MLAVCLDCFWGRSRFVRRYLGTLFCCLFLPQLSATVLIEEDYEAASGFSEGALLQSVSSWLVLQGEATITAAEAHGGAQSVRLHKQSDSESHTEIQRSLVPLAPGDIAWTDFWLKPTIDANGANTITLDGAYVAFSPLEGEAIIQVYDGDGLGGGEWVATFGTIALEADDRATDWQRLTFAHDFVNQEWALYHNGVLLADRLGFDRLVSNADALILFGNDLGDSYFDDFRFLTETPLAALEEEESPVSQADETDGSDSAIAFVPGLQYAYFEPASWLLSLSQLDTLTPDKSGNVSFPDLRVRGRDENFGFRFTGYIRLPENGEYTFYLTSDDGSRLEIGDSLVIDNGGLHSSRTRKASAYLEAGDHPIHIRYFELLGSEKLRLQIKGPNLSKQTVPESFYLRVDDGQPNEDGHLDPVEPPANPTQGLMYEYVEAPLMLSLPDFDEVAPDKMGNVASFDLGIRERDYNFAVLYSGFITIPEAGEYTFFTKSDDGSELYIGDTLVVDNGGLHAKREEKGNILLEAGLHPIRVSFFEHVGSEFLKVKIKGPGLSKREIPSSMLVREDDGEPNDDGFRDAEDLLGLAFSGLDYEYYETSPLSQLPDFDALVPVKIGRVDSPTLSPRERDDDFAFRFSGFIEVPADAEYVFTLKSDDGSQLFIGDRLVVDNDGLHAKRKRTGKLGLNVGLHPITVTYFERSGKQSLKVTVKGNGEKVETYFGARGSLSGSLAKVSFLPTASPELDASGILVTLTDTATLETRETLTDVAGAFHFDLLKDGLYQLSASSENFLLPCGDFFVSVGDAVDLGALTLRGGDVDGDGVIQTSDQQALSDALRSVEGDANFDGDADLNEDGVIDIVDMAILGASFGERADCD